MAFNKNVCNASPHAGPADGCKASTFPFRRSLLHAYTNWGRRLNVSNRKLFYSAGPYLEAKRSGWGASGKVVQCTTLIARGKEPTQCT